MQYYLIFNDLLWLWPHRGIKFEAVSDEQARTNAEELWRQLPIEFFCTGYGLSVCGYDIYEEQKVGEKKIRKHYRFVNKQIPQRLNADLRT